MSVPVSSAVWWGSQHVGSEKLLLLAIADFANDDGKAFPSVPKLAKMCGTTVRHCNRLLAAVIASGELERYVNAGPKGANRYRLNLAKLGPAAAENPDNPKNSRKDPSPPVAAVPCHAGPHPLTSTSAPLTPTSHLPDARVPSPLTPTSDEPSINHQENHQRTVREPVRARESRTTTSIPAPKPKSASHFLG